MVDFSFFLHCLTCLDFFIYFKYSDTFKPVLSAMLPKHGTNQLNVIHLYILKHTETN